MEPDCHNRCGASRICCRLTTPLMVCLRTFPWKAAPLGMLLCSACTPLSTDELEPIPAGTGSQVDSGRPDATPQGGTGGGAVDSEVPCVASDEICNGIDDDCDQGVDEETEDYCSTIVVNARTACVTSDMRPQCVLIACFEGFDSCNGDPTDGCECREGSEDDAGLEDGGQEDSGA